MAINLCVNQLESRPQGFKKLRARMTSIRHPPSAHSRYSIRVRDEHHSLERRHFRRLNSHKSLQVRVLEA